jgi:hypothetical protein
VTEQEIVDSLYARIREANSQLYGMRSKWRFRTCVDMYQLDPDDEVEPPTPSGLNSANPTGWCAKVAAGRCKRVGRAACV